MKTTAASLAPNPATPSEQLRRIPVRRLVFIPTPQQEMRVTEFKTIRYKTDEGTRNGLLVGEGPKWLKLILPDCRGIRVIEVPVSEQKFITEIDVPVKRALETLKVHARLVGCLKSAAEVLGIRPIEPPRQDDLSSPTPSMMKKEFENMARAIPKSKKATDKKPREKAAKAAGAKEPGPTVRARDAGLAYIKSKGLNKAKLADREVSAAVREAMRNAAPDAADATIATQFSQIKRNLAA